jgi:hypothetical protein
MDCPNCGAYNASNSYRCRRCNHILPTDDDSASTEGEWGPASGPEERWDEHFRQEEPTRPQNQEPDDSSDVGSWNSSGRSEEPTQPADWDIAQQSSDPRGDQSNWETPTPRGDETAAMGSGDVPNYLWPSIAATLCCCAPLGIPAIIYASRVDAYMVSGDHALAQEASSKARTWALASFGVAAMFWIAIICTGQFGGQGV